MDMSSESDLLTTQLLGLFVKSLSLKGTARETAFEISHVL